MEETDHLVGLGADSFPVKEKITVTFEEKVGNYPILFEGDVFLQLDGFVP